MFGIRDLLNYLDILRLIHTLVVCAISLKELKAWKYDLERAEIWPWKSWKLKIWSSFNLNITANIADTVSCLALEKLSHKSGFNSTKKHNKRYTHGNCIFLIEHRKKAYKTSTIKQSIMHSHPVDNFWYLHNWLLINTSILHIYTIRDMPHLFMLAGRSYIIRLKDFLANIETL